MADVAFAEDPELIEEEGVEAEAANDTAHLLIRNLESPNLAIDLDSSTLALMGSKVIEEYELDLQSRKDAGWDDRNKKAIDLALQVVKPKSFPWPNASNVKYPLIATAAIQFGSRALPAIVPGMEVVKGRTMGRPTPEKRQRADRIGAHMSYQLMVEMKEWEEETDHLLHILPITGNVFRKTYFDPLKGRNVSELVLADKLVVNYWSKPLSECPRITHVVSYYPHEIEAKFRSKVWRRVEIGQTDSQDDQAPHEFYEQHRLWDLDEDGYPEPYIVTVHKETEQVVRVFARYDANGIRWTAEGEVECIEPIRYFTKYGFIPSLDGSFYDIGFGTLLDALNESINTSINQINDAATLANTGGGFLGAGISMRTGTLRFQPGEWKKVESTGPDLKASIVPLPAPEPSPVLFQLLGMLIEAAKDITATKDILTGESGRQNQPVGTTLAMIEQGLKSYTAIIKRIHRALGQEAECLYKLNGRYLEEDAYFTFQDQEGVIAREDYRAGDCDVIPVSDPTMATDMQKIGRAQYLQQFMGVPGFDPLKIALASMEAVGISDGQQYLAPPPPPPQPNPKDLADAENKLATADKSKAQAQQIRVETAQMAPGLVQTNETMEAMGLGALQPADMGGMAPAPADQAVPDLPEGQFGGPGEGVGIGTGIEPGAPGQGPAPPGAF